MAHVMAAIKPGYKMQSRQQHNDTTRHTLESAQNRDEKNNINKTQAEVDKKSESAIDEKQSIKVNCAL